MAGLSGSGKAMAKMLIKLIKVDDWIMMMVN